MGNGNGKVKFGAICSKNNERELEDKDLRNDDLRASRK